MIIEMFSLAVFMMMISTGLIMKYILPAGSGRVEMLLSRPARSQRTIEVFLGLSRYEWGEFHFYFSVAFLVLIALHLMLHWSWIKAMTFGAPNAPQPFYRKIVAIVLVLFVVFALIFPWLFKAREYTSFEYRQLKNLPVETD
jgi:hypothetical protein